MRTIALAVAAATILAVRALAKNDDAPAHAYGKNKVCLLTFGTEAGQAGGADADVVGARFLPLPAAKQLESQNSLSDIYSYGPDGSTADGVRNVNPVGNDPAVGITDDMNTQQVCQAFADFAASKTDDGEE